MEFEICAIVGRQVNIKTKFNFRFWIGFDDV